MRIDFSDKSYILVENSKEDRIIISVGAIDKDSPLSLTINTAELTKEEFKKLISELIY